MDCRVWPPSGDYFEIKFGPCLPVERKAGFHPVNESSILFRDTNILRLKLIRMKLPTLNRKADGFESLRAHHVL